MHHFIAGKCLYIQDAEQPASISRCSAMHPAQLKVNLACANKATKDRLENRPLVLCEQCTRNIALPYGRVTNHGVETCR